MMWFSDNIPLPRRERDSLQAQRRRQGEGDERGEDTELRAHDRRK